MLPFKAVLDANVLYNSYLRGYLLWLQIRFTQTRRPVAMLWTEQILDETFRGIQRRNPELVAVRLQQRRAEIERHFPDNFITNYARRIPALQLPDPNDRHVLAAAIEAGARYIVTFNLRDFPAEALRPHGVVAVHPDAFLCELLDRYPAAMTDAVLLAVGAYGSPPFTPCGFLAILESSPQDAAQPVVPAFAARMKLRLGCA